MKHLATAVLGTYPKNETAIVFFGTSFFSASLTFAVLRWFGWRKAESASDEFDDDSFRKAMQRSFLPRYFILLE
ncbi:MAG: hypothetical protein H0W58_08850 [Acidobacteria bacterium]|nr:hypothetical protein [Acidobacteriota bacterium]